MAQLPNYTEWTWTKCWSVSVFSCCVCWKKLRHLEEKGRSEVIHQLGQYFNILTTVTVVPVCQLHVSPALMLCSYSEVIKYTGWSL